MNSLFNQLCFKSIFRFAIVMLVALAWSSIAFCGEIHDAAKNGDLEKVKALLKENLLLVSSKDDNGWVPLHYAAANGYKQVAALLLANKADVNAKSINGYTPLHCAAAGGQYDMAELLLTNKANVNATDTLGETPLDVAEKVLAEKWPGHGQWEVTELLRQHGGHGGIVTSFRDAMQQNDLEKVATFLKWHPDLVFSKDNGGSTPLHIAVQRNYYDVAKLLLANKADVNAKDNDGKTPLHFAVGNNSMSELLRQHGAAGDIGDAIWRNDLEEVRTLLNNNPHLIYSTNINHMTSLQQAVVDGHKQIVELLLANKADINAVGDSALGDTPLHYAARNGDKNLVELLLVNKAAVNVRNNQGCTPLLLAAEFNSSVEVVKLLLKAGADMDARDKIEAYEASATDGKPLKNSLNYATPLIYASMRGNADIVKLLLEAGADKNATDHWGHTALTMAEDNHHTNVANLLRQHGGQE